MSGQGPRGGLELRGPAEQALTLALVQLLDHGRRTPCGEPGAAEAFLSEDHETRATVTGLCQGCPVLELCDAAAVEGRVKFGVWGGKDRTKHPATEARRKRREESR